MSNNSQKEKEVLEKQRLLAQVMKGGIAGRTKTASTTTTKSTAPSKSGSSSSSMTNRPNNHGKDTIRPVTSSSGSGGGGSFKLGGLTHQPAVSGRAQQTTSSKQQHRRPSGAGRLLLNASSSSSSTTTTTTAIGSSITTTSAGPTNEVVDLTSNDYQASSSSQSRSTKTKTKTKTTMTKPSSSSSSLVDNNNNSKKQKLLGIHKSFKRPSAATVMAAARAKAQLDKEQRQQQQVPGMTRDEGNNKMESKDDDSIPLLPHNTKDGTAPKKQKTKLKTETSANRFASLVQNVTANKKKKDDVPSLDPLAVAAYANNIVPEDFWKNIRSWDFVSDLAKQQLEQQQQQQQQQGEMNRSRDGKARKGNQKGEDGSKNNNNNNATKGHDKSNNKSTTTTTPITVKPVPDTFINSRHYVAVWAPLCLAECRAQVLSDVITECGQMNGRTSPFVLVNVEATWKTGSHHRHRGGGGGDWNTNIHSDLTEMIDSCQVCIKATDRADSNRLKFFPNDMCCLVPTDRKDMVENLLLRQRGSGIGVGQQQQQQQQRNNIVDGDNDNAYQRACIVGHTEVHRGQVDGLILKISKRKWAQIGSSEMYLLRLGGNVTSLREFTALCNVDTLPLKQFLLGQSLEKKRKDQSKNSSNGLGHNSRKRPHLDSTTTTGGDNSSEPAHDKEELLRKMGGVVALGKGFMDYAHKKFNPSQLMAISASSQGYGDGGFSLIKGPPGTGKTTTLVSILNALHIRQFNKYYDEVRRIVALPSGNRQSALEMARRAKPRLLVCAPSNAAVDNVILKIMEDGFIDGSGQRYNPSIIRVGVGQSLAVKDVALETKVDQILSENLDVSQLENSIAGYRMELQRISSDIVSCRKRIHAIASASAWPLGKDWEIRVDEETFEETRRVFFVNHREQSTTYECPPPPEPGETQFPARSMPEYRAFMARTVKLVESYFNMKTNLEQTTIVKGSIGSGANSNDVRQNLEMHVLNSVHIVMTTLGTAGGKALSDGVDKFEVVVIDEAAQSVEPATLAALALGSRHCVMVGDPQQLPATIFNVSGKNTKYDRSLFQRLEEAGEEVYMLNEQYRMHPKISHFPRHIFYKGALKDGPNVKKTDYGSPMVEMITSRVPVLQPFTVLDLDSKEERGSTSLSNSTEAHLAVHLYASLKEITNDMVAKSRVAVITPYSQQASLLRRLFEDFLGKDYTKFIEVNTVDAFQGREANIVIFSAVRAAGSHGIGFLSDVRRMNVALTRAKHFLFVIARCKSIVVNPYWNDLVEHARDTNAVVSVPIVGKLNKKQPIFGPLREWRLEHGLNGPSVGKGSNSIPPPPPQQSNFIPPPPPQQADYSLHCPFGGPSSSLIPPPPPPPPPQQNMHTMHVAQAYVPSISPPPQAMPLPTVPLGYGIGPSVPPPLPPPPPPLPSFMVQGHGNQSALPPPPPPLPPPRPLPVDPRVASSFYSISNDPRPPSGQNPGDPRKRRRL